MAEQTDWQQMVPVWLAQRDVDDAFVQHRSRTAAERLARRQVMTAAAQASHSDLQVPEACVDLLLIGTNAVAADAPWLTDEAASAPTAATTSSFRQRGAAFRFDLSPTLWQRERTSRAVRQLLTALETPIDLDLVGWRLAAADAIGKALAVPDQDARRAALRPALEAYARCLDRCPVDYESLFGLGTVLFYELGHSSAALDAWRQAGEAATQHSPYCTALAAVQVSYVHRCRQEFAEALDVGRYAAQVCPDWAETHYQAAAAAASAGVPVVMGHSLHAAVSADRAYWPRACTDPELMPLAPHVDRALRALHRHALAEAAHAVSLAAVANFAADALRRHLVASDAGAPAAAAWLDEAQEALRETRRLAGVQTYFRVSDILAAARQAIGCCQQHRVDAEAEARQRLDTELRAAAEEQRARLLATQERLAAMDAERVARDASARAAGETWLAEQITAFDAECAAAEERSAQCIVEWGHGGRRRTLAQLAGAGACFLVMLGVRALLRGFGEAVSIVENFIPFVLPLLGYGGASLAAEAVANRLPARLARQRAAWPARRQWLADSAARRTEADLAAIEADQGAEHHRLEAEAATAQSEYTALNATLNERLAVLNKVFGTPPGAEPELPADAEAASAAPEPPVDEPTGGEAPPDTTAAASTNP